MPHSNFLSSKRRKKFESKSIERCCKRTRMLVKLMPSQVLSALESRPARFLQAHERPILALLVQLVHVHLKLRFRLEAQLAQLANEVAAVSLDVNGVIAGGVEHQLAVEASRFEAVELHAVRLLQVNAEEFARRELTVAAGGEALVAFPHDTRRAARRSAYGNPVQAPHHVSL